MCVCGFTSNDERAVVCVWVHSNDERAVVCVCGFTVSDERAVVCVWVHSNDERCRCVFVWVHSNDERAVVCVLGFTVMTSVPLCVCGFTVMTSVPLCVCGFTVMTSMLLLCLCLQTRPVQLQRPVHTVGRAPPVQATFQPFPSSTPFLRCCTAACPCKCTFWGATIASACLAWGR